MNSNLSKDEKAERYDWLLREIDAREPSIARVLTGHTRGYAYLPLQSLLRAFDICIDDIKRNALSEHFPRARARQRSID